MRLYSKRWRGKLEMCACLDLGDGMVSQEWGGDKSRMNTRLLSK